MTPYLFLPKNGNIAQIPHMEEHFLPCTQYVGFDLCTFTNKATSSFIINDNIFTMSKRNFHQSHT
jgi:hypothetical protein